jgi:hypothetical protein
MWPFVCCVNLPCRHKIVSPRLRSGAAPTTLKPSRGHVRVLLSSGAESLCRARSDPVAPDRRFIRNPTTARARPASRSPSKPTKRETSENRAPWKGCLETSARVARHGEWQSAPRDQQNTTRWSPLTATEAADCRYCAWKDRSIRCIAASGRAPRLRRRLLCPFVKALTLHRVGPFLSRKWHRMGWVLGLSGTRTRTLKLQPHELARSQQNTTAAMAKLNRGWDNSTK